MSKQDWSKCSHHECGMEGCFCKIGAGTTYGHCILYSISNNCPYFEDIDEIEKEQELDELTKIIEDTFSYAKKYYPDKYEPFELNVYPEEIARLIIENGYRKVK